MKNIAFTICSNNYLSQAKVLSDSVNKYSKDDYSFVIVLCDVFSNRIDYSEFNSEFIEAKDLGIENFDWMAKFYDIVEFNTALKPFAFKHLIAKYHPQFIQYLDPDTCTYQSLKLIEQEMEPDYTMLFTPHSLAPLPFDGKTPTDNVFLNYGIYNLGFLGVRVTEESEKILDWWCGFCREHCIEDPTRGFFVDQLPMELVPLYFNKTKISRNKGINAAYWNLHEREIEWSEDNKIFKSGGDDLILFHFSNLKINGDDYVSQRSDRYMISDSNALSILFNDYISRIKSTKYDIYKSVPCYYTKRHDGLWRKYLKAVLLRGSTYLKAGYDFVKRH